MSNLIKHTPSPVALFTAEQKELIKKTVAEKATDTELELFLHLASSYNLDPFKKEIWFIKFKEGDKPQIYTSRDGYLKIAHASGVFNGMESYTIEDEKGNPIKAVCKVYRKDMDFPFKAEIKISEYKQNTQPWTKYTSAMGIKVAEVFALKRAFSVNGLVTSEELPETNYSVDVTPKYITDAQRKRLYAIAKSENNNSPLPRWSDEQFKDYLKNLGFESSSEITQGEEYEAICEYFGNHAGHFIDVPGQQTIEIPATDEEFDSL